MILKINAAARLTAADNSPATIPKVNKALRDAGYKDVKIYKGKGYYYFSGGVAD